LTNKKNDTICRQKREFKSRNTQHETHHQKLNDLIDEYAHFIYKLTRTFPRDEFCGVAPQLRRSNISVILNYIEGYARIKDKVHKNFLEISYGSLKESKYLLKII
jgi:four helix bundle protein